MTVGIYALYWEEQDLVYIGQSSRLEARHKEHLVDLSQKIHSNYKVQESYNSYGEPKHIIIEYCKIEELDALEIYWTNEFNSLNPLRVLILCTQVR